VIIDKEANMKNRILGALLLAAFVTGAPGPAIAAANPANGCQVLERTVFRTVLVAGSGANTPVFVARQPGRTLVCRFSARAVSAGFTRAMVRRNIFLSWQTPDQERGDLCLSGNLAQCYPRGHAAVPLSQGDALFLADAWYAVMRSLDAAMPGGYAADLARFAVGGLEAGLSRDLRRTLRGRLRQEYDLH
jgi:hypothetical protein